MFQGYTTNFSKTKSIPAQQSSSTDKYKLIYIMFLGSTEKLTLITTLLLQLFHEQ